MANSPERDGAGLIFHIAFERDWNAAEEAGTYEVSTRGALLDEVGFIHAGFQDQVAGVGLAFYRDADEPLVVLTIDPRRLDVPVVVEIPEGGDEGFPHIYGALPAAAVVAVRRASVTADGRFLIDEPDGGATSPAEQG
jgi:uncharacterized protein (DUF952 family)